MAILGTRTASVAPVLDYFVEHRPEDMERAAREFHGENPPAEEIEIPQSIADPLFGGWFLFEYRTLREKRPPLQVYAQEHASRLSSEELAYYRGLLETQFFDFFDVADVVLDEQLTLRRVRDGRVYEVRERAATHNLVVGDVLAARLAFTDGAWEINGGAVPFPPEALPALRLHFQDHPHAPPPSAKEVWQLVVSPAPARALETVADAERALDEFFAREGQQAALRGTDVLAWLKETKDVQKTAQRISARVRLSSDESLKELLALLYDVWNVLPPEERGALVRDVGAQREPGPVERALAQQFLSRISHEVPPHRYRTAEEHAAAMREYQERWLNTPQEAINAATPRAAVREERRARGNPETEWEFHVTTHPLRGVEEERSQALLQEGVEAMRIGDWRTAEQCFRTMAEEQPKHFQAWGNLGLALASRGRKREALEALDRALAINPKYRLAQQNREQIAATPEGALVRDVLVTMGASVIQVGNEEAALAEWRPLVRGEEAEQTPAVRDVRATLAWFSEHGPVRRTGRLKRLPRRAVLELNRRLAKPDPEGMTFGDGRLFRFQDEDEFPTVHLLHHLLLAAGLLQVRFERVSCTRKAEAFAAQPATEQYFVLLWAYFNRLSWSKLERAGGWMPVPDRSRQTRDLASLTVREFLEKPREDGWIRLRGRGEETPRAETASAEAHEQELAQIMVEVDDEKFLWRPLAWFGLLEFRESHEGDPWSFALAARCTPLGERVLPTLAPKRPMPVAMPKPVATGAAVPAARRLVGRNDPCPCGAQKDGKPVKYKKCHGQ